MANLTEDCSAARPLLSAYADGEATATETAFIKGHLAQCAACASQLAFTRAMNVALGAAPIERPSPELFERIAAATFARPTLRQRIAEWLTPAPTRWAMGTALAVITLAVVLPRNYDTIAVMIHATPDAGLAQNLPARDAVATTGIKTGITSAPSVIAPKPTTPKTSSAAKEPIIARADSERKTASAPKNTTIARAIDKKTIPVVEATAKAVKPGDDSTPRIAQDAKRTITPNPTKRNVTAPPKTFVAARNNGSAGSGSHSLIAKTPTAPLSPTSLNPETKPAKVATAAPVSPAEISPTLIKPEPQPRVAAQEPEGAAGVKVAMAESPRENSVVHLISFKLKASQPLDYKLSPADTSGTLTSKSGNISIVGARGGL